MPPFYITAVALCSQTGSVGVATGLGISVTGTAVLVHVTHPATVPADPLPPAAAL